MLFVGSVLFSGIAYAAPLTVACNVTSLIEAIDAANANGVPDVLDLTPGCVYTLYAVHNGTSPDANGLPIISSDVTINGHGAIIVRDGSAPELRILKVNNDGILRIHELTLQNGYAQNGGGIYNAGSLTVAQSTFKSDWASVDGGGIFNLGSAMIVNTTFNDARANGFVGYGGGIANTISGTVVLSNSTFAVGSARYGGGVSNRGGMVSIASSTFTGNVVRRGGGGVLNDNGTMSILNATFSANKGKSGGASVGSVNGTLTLQNTIVANSISGNGCYGTIVDQGGNLHWSSWDTMCLGIDGDPRLGALANNGGWTQTMALLPGSQAIDAGVNANCPATDQRGVNRPIGVRCDVGAYESSIYLFLPLIAR